MQPFRLYIFFILSCIILSRSNESRHAKKYSKNDTVQVIQAVLNFPETDSIIPEYRDSVLKIIKSKYITSQFSILWKNKPVIYLDSNARTMEIDTLGIHAAIKREKNDPIPKNERPAPSFEILFLNLFITDSSAESHTFLKNSGIDAYYQLKKQNEEWIVTKCKWRRG